jgi:hypothetical protein
MAPRDDALTSQHTPAINRFEGRAVGIGYCSIRSAGIASNPMWALRRWCLDDFEFESNLR